jgi:CheY-like chemotaxis protein
MTRKSVLLVEDDDSIALALQFLIRREGHDLERVATGPDALDAVRSRAPDLVLLDARLPGCSGYDVCRQIRRDPALARTRILMMTASAAPADRGRSLALGADAFVDKPFSMAELRGVVRRLLAA